MTRDGYRGRSYRDLKRVRAKPHAHDEEEIEARQALPVHPDLDRVPPDAEISSERL